VKCIDLTFGWKCGKCPDGYVDKIKTKGRDLVSALTSKQVCTDIDECKRKRNPPCPREAECTNIIVSIIIILLHDIYTSVHV